MKVQQSRHTATAGLMGGVHRLVTTPTPEVVKTEASLPVDRVRQAMMGIPAHEVTEKVREALVTLLTEVETLRRELDRKEERIQELEKLADTDTLSPVTNRRAFVRELARAISYSDRYDVPSSILFFDVNGLKQINDTFGHRAGDAALMHVADALQKNVRTSDVVGRLGGDEYAVILTHADEAQAGIKAEALTNAITGTPLVFDGHTIKVSASVGVYTFRPGESANDVLDKADRAMYRQKAAAAQTP